MIHYTDDWLTAWLGDCRAILIDLSADYLDQALTRNQQAPLGV